MTEKQIRVEVLDGKWTEMMIGQPIVVALVAMAVGDLIQKLLVKENRELTSCKNG